MFEDAPKGAVPPRRCDVPKPEYPEIQFIEPDVPDPNGPPRAVRSGPSIVGCLGTVLACGGLFILIATSMTPCAGATRSAQLEWQRRQELIELAWQEEQARRSQVGAATTSDE